MIDRLKIHSYDFISKRIGHIFVLQLRLTALRNRNFCPVIKQNMIFSYALYVFQIHKK